MTGVLVGFLDGQGRAYDLNFRTMKRRLRDVDGGWEIEAGETFSAGVSVEAAMFLQMPRPHLLLRPTSGSAYATGRRLLFVAGEAVPRTPEEPTTYNVAIRVPPTAVDQLFREMGGREILEIRRDEVRGSTESRSELTLRIAAKWIGGDDPTEFLLILRPIAAARQAVAPLALS
ncbi:MAG: hypothetical protein E6K18_06320 [Methanobacteriota archaeon]|nr:MAG: hypothetical protein E6K18_06320 [Euryarchaeota archaeon]